MKQQKIRLLRVQQAKTAYREGFQDGIENKHNRNRNQTYSLKYRMYNEGYEDGLLKADLINYG